MWGLAMPVPQPLDWASSQIAFILGGIGLGLAHEVATVQA